MEVYIRYSFNNDNGQVTTAFVKELEKLGFSNSGTGSMRSPGMSVAKAKKMLTILSKHLGGIAVKSKTVTVDHFVLILEQGKK